MKFGETFAVLPSVALFLIAGCSSETKVERTNQYVYYLNCDFEEVASFTKTTPEGIREAVEDCIVRADCWVEEENWLEVGITDELAYEGEKCAQIVSYEIPSGYEELFAAVAHYAREQSDVEEGVFETGAWFYVPDSKEPLAIIGMEYHPSWVIQYFAYAAIDARDGSVLVPNSQGWTRVGQVKFIHDN